MNATTPGERPHGTRARYAFGPSGSDPANGCRCQPCAHASTTYEKQRRRARSRGIPAFIDATETARHIDFLTANGVGRRTIAAAAGLSKDTVERIATRQVIRIRPETADRILGVHLGHASPGAYIDAWRALEQIHDLIHEVGMTRQEIAGALGYPSPALQIAKRGRITRENADRVDRLWRERMAPIHARREHDRTRRAHYRALARQAAAS